MSLFGERIKLDFLDFAQHFTVKEEKHRLAPAATQAPPQLPPGALFGVPGYTQLTEQRDNNDGFVVNLATATQTDLVSAGVANFKQTDVVFWWELDVAFVSTYTPGTSAVTQSAYFPWNVVQSTVLSIQNLFKPVEVINGIDAAIFQAIRPSRSKQNEFRTNLFANPALTWQTTTLAQANLVGSTALATTSTAYNLTFELAASLFFDIYYHLDKSGSPVPGVMQPQRCIVSPVYMAGSARFVQPQIRFAAGSVSNLDFGPANIGAGTGTYAGSATIGVRRVGVYGSNDPRTLPPVMNPWQYRRMSTSFGVGGRTIVDIPLQAVAQPGQILSVFCRMWDPSANGGLGAPININTVTRCQLQYGSGLLRYDDIPKTAQRRIMSQHGFLLPVGVLGWDLATDQYGRVSNAGAINTLTTAGVNVHLEFTGALSATAYIVVLTELLVIVE